MRKLIAANRLFVADAAQTLDKFMRQETPSPIAFDEVVGTIVGRMAAGKRVWIYGEMVDVLAARGNYRGAQLLEDLWNLLGQRECFTLFCGYASGHFGDPRTAEALAGICAAHDHVHRKAEDILAEFLLDQQRLRQPRARYPVNRWDFARPPASRRPWCTPTRYIRTSAARAPAFPTSRTSSASPRWRSSTAPTKTKRLARCCTTPRKTAAGKPRWRRSARASATPLPTSFWAAATAWSRIPEDKLPWRERKENYLAHLEHASTSVCLVSAADKLHNVRSIMRDYREHGEDIWERFQGRRDGTLWYYETVADTLLRRYRTQLTRDLQDEVDELLELTKNA